MKPAAISRSATTTSLLSSDATSARAPFLSCLVRIEAICTRWNRFGTFSVQSSTVMRAMVSLSPVGAASGPRDYGTPLEKETPADEAPAGVLGPSEEGRSDLPLL